MYDYNEIQIAINKLKKFPKTTRIKAMHKTKVNQLKDFIYNNIYNINPYLFDPENYYTLKEYKLATELDYNKLTKKQLDNKLDRVLYNLKSDLNSILREII